MAQCCFNVVIPSSMVANIKTTYNQCLCYFVRVVINVVLIYSQHPNGTTTWTNADLMLAHHPQCWLSIKTNNGLFGGVQSRNSVTAYCYLTRQQLLSCYFVQSHNAVTADLSSKQLQLLRCGPMLGECMIIVADSDSLNNRCLISPVPAPPNWIITTC